MRLFRHPVLCNYYLTYRCNAACSFCDIWEIPSPYATVESVSSNLRELKKMGVKVIDFTGGEPLLHRNLPEFLELAQSLGFITTVTTNTLLYPKQAESLKGKVDMLHFSLDSIIPEKHNQSRGVKCFDYLMKSVQVAKTLGERPDILFTVMEDNVDEIPLVYEEFVEKQGLLLILNPIFEYNAVGSPLGENAMGELQKWKGRRGVYLNSAFLSLRKEGGNQIQSPVCKAASSTIVISPENRLILPCYHLKINEFDIRNQLQAVYESAEVQALVKEEGRLPGCQGCTVNCYMEPSMAVETGRYFWSSLPSTLKYSLEKWVWA